MVRMQIQFTEEGIEALRREAAQRHVSISAVVRDAVDERLDSFFGELDLHADHGGLLGHNDGTTTSMMASTTNDKMTLATRSGRGGEGPPRRQKLSTQSAWYATTAAKMPLRSAAAKSAVR